MTKSRYITSPPSDMVLPGRIAGGKGTDYALEEALSITRSVLTECVASMEHAYLQDHILERALKRTLQHLYGLRAKRSAPQ